MEKKVPVAPPDGGWGWMVVLGSFMCNVVVDGIIFSYGLFLPELARDLGESKGTLAWVGSLLAGFYLIAGPIVSGLANTYGTRPVTIVGTLISAASFAAASFSSNLLHLCLAFGVCGGIGFGFIYLPAVVTVGFYFERRRAFATGLAVCGSGVGTFLVAPLVQFLLARFDWRGTLLVLSGLVLNCAIFGALFRPLAPPPPKPLQKPLLQRVDQLKGWGDALPAASVSLPEISQQSDPPPSYSEVLASDLRPFYRQDILYSASLLHLPQFAASNGDLRAYAASVTRLPAPDPPGGGCLSPAMRDTFRQMLDLSLLRSPTFLLLGAGGFLTLAGFFVPFVFAVDRATQAGVSRPTLLLPAVGVANTVGRVFCGWLSDRPGLDALTLNNAALVVAGIATALSTCLTSLEGLLAYGAVFGFCIGCFATLRSIVIVELLGLEKLTNAFGLLLLFQGIASMIGSPVAGMFYDATGSYDAPFYIAGALILVSGLLGLPLPHLSRWEKRRREAVDIVIRVESPDEEPTVAPSQLRRFSYDVILEQPADKTCVYKTRLVPKLHSQPSAFPDL